jgi:hypothetical protein
VKVSEYISLMAKQFNATSKEDLLELATLDQPWRQLQKDLSTIYFQEKDRHYWDSSINSQLSNIAVASGAGKHSFGNREN